MQRYDGPANVIRTGPGQGDDRHLKHTHISYFRDSEKRDKLFLFQPFFDDVAYGNDVSADIRKVDPKGKKVALAIRRAGHDFGSVIDLSDLIVALNNIKHPFGGNVDPSDVKALMKH